MMHGTMNSKKKNLESLFRNVCSEEHLLTFPPPVWETSGKRVQSPPSVSLYFVLTNCDIYILLLLRILAR